MSTCVRAVLRDGTAGQGVQLSVCAGKEGDDDNDARLHVVRNLRMIRGEEGDVAASYASGCVVVAHSCDFDFFSWNAKFPATRKKGEAK